MNPPAPRIWLVIPAWCETERLDTFVSRLFPALAASGQAVAVQIVDDGSPSCLAEALAARCETWRQTWPWVQALHRLPANRGKGGAVYAGWDLAPTNTPWLAFCDADGSVDAGELVRLFLLLPTPPAPAVFCTSRHLPGAIAVWGSLSRRGLSRLFSAWVRFHTALPIRDTQCGAKAMSAPLYRSLRAGLRETRFAFDVELLLAARCADAELREIPIRWTWRPGSRLRLGRDGWAMLHAVRRLRRRGKKV
jgi:glycosyltransferase involved in cell wall biosynthesis